MQWQHPFSPSTLCLERNICYLNRIITQGEKHGQHLPCEVCGVNLNAVFSLLFVANELNRENFAVDRAVKIKRNSCDE